MAERAGRRVSATLITRWRGRPIVAFTVTDPSRSLAPEAERHNWGACKALEVFMSRLGLVTRQLPPARLDAWFRLTRRNTMTILTHSELRSHYAQPQERARRKELRSLDHHCRDFIALSPFVVLSTCDEEHNLDASPRGGDPGFVKVTDDGRLLLPDSPGNNRLDSFQNIISTGKVGLLFLIPGFDETLRVNGNAILSTQENDIRSCATERRAPKVVVRVTVTAAYLHCAKAFLRSKLWSESSQVARRTLPTAGQMISDQTGLQVAPETREEMERRYASDL